MEKGVSPPGNMRGSGDKSGGVALSGRSGRPLLTAAVVPTPSSVQHTQIFHLNRSSLTQNCSFKITAARCGGEVSRIQISVDMKDWEGRWLVSASEREVRRSKDRRKTFEMLPRWALETWKRPGKRGDDDAELSVSHFLFAVHFQAPTHERKQLLAQVDS